MTAAFAVGALALSALMAGLTYFTARQAFLNERQGANQRQAFVNASLIENSLRTPGVNVDQLIGSVDTLPGSLSVLHTGGQWYATSISVGQSAIPVELRDVVLGGRAASQIVSVDGTPDQIIGVPLPSEHAVYFEVFSLTELEGTLRTLAIALGAAALVTTVAGAVVGRWASGRALRPLSRVTDAAVAIAGGRLDTRVEAGDDVDLQELAEAFNRMTGNLQERIEREARFTSDVSHELRSPLTTLSATVGVLESHRDQLDPRAASALDLLDGDLKRFTRMVDDLLEISRVDAGSAELSLDEVDPGELVKRAVQASAPVSADGFRLPVSFPVEVDQAVEGSDCGWTSAGSSGSWPISSKTPVSTPGGSPECSSPSRPLGPAARTARAGAPNTDGRAGVEGNGDPSAAGPRLQVVVEDRGPGIPHHERRHLFERFYRGSRSGHRAASGGTGLGLSLVAEHVRLHGGAVWVEDAPEHGSRFVVELPVTTGEPATTDDRDADRE